MADKAEEVKTLKDQELDGASGGWFYSTLEVKPDKENEKPDKETLPPPPRFNHVVDI